MEPGPPVPISLVKGLEGVHATSDGGEALAMGGGTGIRAIHGHCGQGQGTLPPGTVTLSARDQTHAQTVTKLNSLPYTLNDDGIILSVHLSFSFSLRI